MDLESEEEYTLARAIRPYRDNVAITLDSKLSLENSIEKLAADDLEDFGFNVHWPDSPGPNGVFPSLWAGLDADIQAAHRRVVYLALASVAFVFSLVFFTFAQLAPDGSRSERWLGIIGSAIGAGALVYALVVNPTAWRTFIGAVVFFSAFGFAGWKLSGRFKSFTVEDPEDEVVHPGEVDPMLFPGVRVHAGEAKDWFKRSTVMAIALTALCSALAGYWYARPPRRRAGRPPRPWSTRCSCSRRVRARRPPSTTCWARWRPRRSIGRDWRRRANDWRWRATA